MKARTLATIAFGPGARLILTEGQAATRPNALRKLGNGLYETTASVQFKAGEQIGIEGEVSKALLASLEPIGTPAKPAKKHDAPATDQRAPVV